MDQADTHSEHSHADVDRHVRAAVIVFGALLVLTGVTVGVSYLHLAPLPAITLALAIALAKGSLVAGWFMHLVSERHLIYGVLILTGAFFVALLLLPVFTAQNAITL